jgi:hypothetical protein
LAGEGGGEEVIIEFAILDQTIDWRKEYRSRHLILKSKALCADGFQVYPVGDRLVKMSWDEISAQSVEWQAAERVRFTNLPQFPVKVTLLLLVFAFFLMVVFYATR